MVSVPATNCETAAVHKPPTTEELCPVETNETTIVEVLPNGIIMIENPMTNTNGLSITSKT